MIHKANQQKAYYGKPHSRVQHFYLFIFHNPCVSRNAAAGTAGVPACIR